MQSSDAERLIALEKKVIEDGVLRVRIRVNFSESGKIRIPIASVNQVGELFFLEITQSDKNAVKISFHHQEKQSNTPLLRIDFNSRHKNPAEIKPTLPQKFWPFAGIYLDQYEGHIHYVVDGYDTLQWAIPLEEDPFPYKTVGEPPELAKLLTAIFALLNVKTEIQGETQTKLWLR